MADGKMMNDELGDWGETRFETVCTSAHLIANKSSRDKMGWDYHVELPPQPSALPLDQQVNALSCLVQVKTKWLSSDNGVDLSLSAAQRLAMRTAPAFVLVLFVEESPEGSGPRVAECYLIHLLDDNLAHILKRLREEEVDPDHKPLNQLVISFDPRKAGKRIEFQGNALREALLQISGPDPHAYVLKKEEQLKKLGYDKRRYHVSLKFDPLTIHDYNDMMLGRKPGTPKQIEVKDVRFGMPVRIPEMSGDAAKITVTPSPVTECVIRVRSETSDGAVVFHGDVITTVHLFSERELGVFLYRTAFFDLEFSGKGELTFHAKMATSDIKLPLEEWVDYLRLCHTLASQEVTFEVDSSAPVAFHGEISAVGNGMEAPWAKPLLETTRQAIKLVKYVAGDAGLVRIDFIARNARIIDYAYSLIFKPDLPRRHMSGVFNFAAEGSPFDELPSPDNPATFFVPVWMRIGNTLLIFACRMQLEMKLLRPKAYQVEEVEASLIQATSLPLSAEAFRTFAEHAQEASGLKCAILSELTDKDLEEPPLPEPPVDGQGEQLQT